MPLNDPPKDPNKKPDVDARVIASGTTGFSGAQLANLVNEAALACADGGAGRSGLSGRQGLRFYNA